MKQIFIDLVGRITMEEYEIRFMKETGTEYKDYLYKQYVTNNYTLETIANELGTNKSKITNHLKYYNIKRDKQQHGNNIYTKTIGMIEKETGRKFEDIYNELIAEGLTVTQIADKLKLNNMSSISSHLYQVKRNKERKGNQDKLIIQGLAGKKPKVAERMFREQLGIEIKDFLKQKYIDEGLSLQDISDLIGISPRRLSDKVRSYGLIKTLSEARQNAIERGTINYTDINRKSRLSREKHTGKSNKQEMFRELIKYHLQFVIDQYTDIEIVMGYNEYCVLNNLEIDIPIIIIYKNKLIKLALEYDGDYWHKDNERELNKENLLKEKQWELIRVEEPHTKSNSLGYLEEKAKETIEQIIKYINI